MMVFNLLQYNLYAWNLGSVCNLEASKMNVHLI